MTFQYYVIENVSLLCCGCFSVLLEIAVNAFNDSLALC